MDPKWTRKYFSELDGIGSSVFTNVSPFVARPPLSLLVPTISRVFLSRLGPKTPAVRRLIMPFAARQIATCRPISTTESAGKRKKSLT